MQNWKLQHVRKLKKVIVFQPLFFKPWIDFPFSAVVKQLDLVKKLELGKKNMQA